MPLPDHMPPPSLLDDLLAESSARHRHVCPRQVLGIRMGLFGLRLLGFFENGYTQRFCNDQKHLLAIVETDGCGADGVAAATDSHVGRRTLRVLDFGKMAVTLIDTRAYRPARQRRLPLQGIRIAPRAAARDLAQLCIPDAPSRWHAYLDAYQRLPDTDLLQAQPVQLTHSLADVLSRPDVRVLCDACGEEIINERERIVDGRTLCRPCAGEGYYLPLDAPGA